jgi:phenylacetate-CoA ligase
MQWKGYPIKEAMLELEKIQAETAIDSHRNQQYAWQIFQFHLDHNAWYAQWIDNKKLSTWNDIPVLTKADMQVDMSERLTYGYHRKNTHVHNTSGSTGTPFFFSKDKFCHAMSWALIHNRFGWHGIEIGRDLQARFYGIPLNPWKYRMEQIKDRIATRVRFPVFDLSDSVLAGYVKRFKNKPFRYVNGYTSSLVLMARYCLRNQIVMKEICPTLQAVFTTSEVCDDIDRRLIASGFGVKVVNEYGAAELDLIGFEDADGNFLLSNETVMVEVVDENNLPVPDGVVGRVLVTSLYNKSMPFIRYELGDRMVLTGKTKHGYKIIDRVEGRTNDIAKLPSGKISPGLTFYYISKSLLEGGGFMKEFIIKQKALHHFHFEYVADREILPQEEENVRQAMNTYLEPGLKATFERLDKIQRTAAGKLKHFFSEL